MSRSIERSPHWGQANFQVRPGTATTAELVHTPGAVTGRLLLPLLRVLDGVETHQPILTDPSPAGQPPATTP